MEKLFLVCMCYEINNPTDCTHYTIDIALNEITNKLLHKVFVTGKSRTGLSQLASKTDSTKFAKV